MIQDNSLWKGSKLLRTSLIVGLAAYLLDYLTEIVGMSSAAGIIENTAFLALMRVSTIVFFIYLVLMLVELIIRTLATSKMSKGDAKYKKLFTLSLVQMFLCLVAVLAEFLHLPYWLDETIMLFGYLVELFYIISIIPMANELNAESKINKSFVLLIEVIRLITYIFTYYMTSLTGSWAFNNGVLVINMIASLIMYICMIKVVKQLNCKCGLVEGGC